MRDQNLDDSASGFNCADWSGPQKLESFEKSGRAIKVIHDQQQAALENLFENNIIPRLLLAHKLVPVPSPVADDLTAARLSECVDQFAEIVINRDAAASIAFFEERRKQGASIEQLFQDLLAPTARRLGTLWEEDINDFMDVTRGVLHLQQIVNEYSTEFKNEGRAPISGRRALIMPLPGEQHTFGASLVGEQFRREGWRVWGGPPRSVDDIIELVDGQWFDMIGLSASKLPEPDRVAADIRAIRRASHNKSVKVMIGGRVFTDSPELVAQAGADATAIDGRQAVLQVTALVGPSRKAG